MNSPKTVLLALGSNLGNRLGYLQAALDQIHENIGWVREVSGIYETPAWGFEGNSFFNACTKIETRLDPQQILKSLQGIENELGRERNNSGAIETG